MIYWAYVRWWLAFVTSNVFGGLSPAKDWLKHWLPVLWPKDKVKANSDPEAEPGISMNDRGTEGKIVLEMLTAVLGQTGDIKRLLADLEEQLKVQEPREEAALLTLNLSDPLTPAICGCHEGYLDRFASEIDRAFRHPGDGR
ncbi:hypothetical protein BDV26DRAFT_289248 [Aspergillus bertholletiae]|uniref:Uncharacterized protein n=1 Tax=Aspergillus bertholletiae TaxID=1226010 RepID=A0A5N7BIJ5_9EURO|nr:hypothetical protein BDV26DRAFT_289248 [Aspergillus bertholletiae]